MSNLKENSTKLLELIYQLSKGDANEIISRKNLGKSLGFSEKEAKQALSFLDREGMTRYILFNCLCITHYGIAEAENLINQNTGNNLLEGYQVSVLFLAADPTNASRLRLGEEVREIGEKLQLSRMRKYFKLEKLMSVRPADLTQALIDVRPRIVHFSGHGIETEGLCFENKLGQIHIISADSLAALFENFADEVNCVVLNACYSEIQAKAIAKNVKYVIGMNQSIGDRAAIAFSIGFYQALGGNRTIKAAYKLGCVQIQLEGIPEHSTPVLIEREH